MASSDSDDDFIANKPNKYGVYISNSVKEKANCSVIDSMIITINIRHLLRNYRRYRKCWTQTFNMQCCVLILN